MPALQLLATWTSSESGMYSSEYYGPQVEIYRPDTAQFVSENIWHVERFCISQTSVGLAINCFLWDKPQAPLPSVENHLMEGVVTLGAIFFLSHDWLTALPLSISLPFSVCLCSSISIFCPSNPSFCSLFRSNRSCKHLWFSINFSNGTSVVCLSVSLQSIHWWRE